MAQISLHWDGASLGDADALVENAADGIGYRLSNEDYESPFIDRMMRALLNGTGNRGVLKGWLNELAVTGVATPVSVNTGGAIIYGLWYENDAAANVAITTPTNDTRVDRVVIRRDWSAQTARITLVSGVEGGAAPAITQSPAPDGTGIYDIPLAQCSITTGGVITVTDEREFVTFSTAPIDNIFGTAHLANESVDWTARQTRTKRLFMGGGDLQPSFGGVSGQRFSYTSSSYLSFPGSLGNIVWGNSAVTEEGWRATVNDDYGFYTAFRTPTDWVSGNLDVYLWWMRDGGDLGYVNSAYQIWVDDETVVYSGEYGRVNCTASVAVDGNVDRHQLLSVSSSQLDGDLDELIYYVIECDSYLTQALVLGIEVSYTGYL